MKGKVTYLIVWFKVTYLNILLCILALAHYTCAQTKIDTLNYNLPQVAITASKQTQLFNSKKQIAFDSIILNNYSTTSVSDLLSSQSTIHIKSYGNGNIATTSMRGGNANHTALLWNGLNINNAMLGQLDLSIIQTHLFDNITLEYGGGSSLWGSGAIGGSIALGNTLNFNKGLSVKLSVSSGSFNTNKLFTSVMLSYHKIASNTRVYYTTSANNYSYTDTTDKEQPYKKITHANFSQKGLMQELAFKLSQVQTLNVRCWYNNTFRNLPTYVTNAISKQHQVDDNLKLSADWNYSKLNKNHTIRLAYFNEKLNYIDSLAAIYSKSTINTLIAESDNTWAYKNHWFNVGSNYTQYQSNLSNKELGKSILEKHELKKLAFFAAYKIHFFNSKFQYTVSVRKEFSNTTQIPFTGNTGIHYQITKNIATKVNANTSFRQPTLNDLYWNPGGNINLKPEQSKELEGGIEFKRKLNAITILMEATYFNKNTTNWIIWLPSNSGNYWSPKNIAEVYSRGTETKTELSYKKNNWQTKLSINTSYVLSTNQKVTNDNDNSFGRQLIYIPRYNGNASFFIAYKTLSLIFNQTYTGYRFTSTDNTSWLSPYYLSSVKCNYSHSLKKVKLSVFASVNNVFNKNYMVVANRPMPLQNLEAGITLHYNKSKTNN